MPKRLDGTYNEILKRLRDRGGDFSVKEDENFPGHVSFIDNITKRRLSLNLSRHETNNGGGVWVVGYNNDGKMEGKPVIPVINADMRQSVPDDYNSDVAEIDYTGTSSTGVLSNMIYSAFRGTGKRGNPKKLFNKFLLEGDEERGFIPAPSIPTSHVSNQRVALNQIGFTMTVDGKAALPDEQFEIRKNFMYNEANAFNPNVKPSGIRNDVNGDARELSFDYLYRGRYLPNEHGRLEPSFGADVNAVQVHGQWMMNTKPSTLVKSNKLSAVSDPAVPYKIVEGIAVPLRPQPTTNTSRPSYAISNLLMPNEEQAAGYERRTIVFDNFPVPGAGVAYNNPNQSPADFWGKQSEIVKTKLASLNLNKMISGQQTIEVGDFAGKVHGGGSRSSVFGTVTTDGVAEKIKIRFGASEWRSTGSAQLIMPQYVNPTSGEFSPDEKKGYVKTESFHSELQKAAAGMLLKYAPVDDPVFSAPGALESGTSIKGFQNKFSEMFVGLDQEISGKKVTHYTGELKGNAFLYGYFGGMSYNQLRGLSKQWERLSPDGMGGKVRQYLKDNYSAAASAGRELSIDFNQMAKDIGYDQGNGLGLLVDWFAGTILSAKPESARNRSNIKRYGAGYASGWMQLGVVHQDQLDHMRSNWERAGNNPDAFNKTFRMTPFGNDGRGKSLYKGQARLSEGAMIIDMLSATRMEYKHGSTMTQEWMQSFTEKYPAFAEALGGNVENFKPKGKAQTAAAGIFAYAVHQGANRDAILDPGSEKPMPPSQVSEISNATLSDIQSHIRALRTEKQSPAKILSSVAESFFPQEKYPEINGLFYNQRLDQYIPNPHAILSTTFREHGIEAAGLAREAVDMFSQLGGIVSEPLGDEGRIVRQGLEAARPLQEAAQKLITGTGEFAKRLLGREFDSSVSGRYRANLALADDEMYTPFDVALTVAKQSGFKGQAALREAKRIMNMETLYVGYRNPDTGSGVETRRKITEKDWRGRFESEKAYDAARSDPRNRGSVSFAYSQATGAVGDFDFDPHAGVLGLKRIGNELKSVDDPLARADVMTAEKIAALEESIFSDKGARNMYNASVKQLADYADRKKVVQSALEQKKNYSPMEFIGKAWDRLLNKTVGMGVGYNPRRAVLGGMAAQGYSTKEIARVTSSLPGFYQPALDTALVGREAAGVAAASMISSSYYHQGYGEEKRNLWRIKKPGGVARTNTLVGEPGNMKVIPQEGGAPHDVDVDELLLSNSPQELLDLSGFVSEGFAQGYTVGGKHIGMSKAQFAGWFAASGDADSLEENLTDDTSLWAKEVVDYHRNLYAQARADGLSHTAAVEKVLSTPALNAIHTRAEEKAITGYNKVTKKESVTGSHAVREMFAKNTSADYQDVVSTSVASYSASSRFKKSNLRGFFPDQIRKAAERMKGPLGFTMKAIASMLNIAVGDDAPRKSKPLHASMKKHNESLPNADDEMASLLDEFSNAAQENREPNFTPEQINMMHESIQEAESRYQQEAAALDSGDYRNKPTTAPIDASAVQKRREQFASNRAKEQKRLKDEATRRKAGTPTVNDVISNLRADAAIHHAPAPDPTPAGGGSGKGGGGDSGTMTSEVPQDDGGSKKQPPYRRGTTTREGTEVRATYERVMDYMQNSPSATEYMHNLLTKMNMPGEATAGSVRDRTALAFRENKAALMSSIDPSMMKQLIELKDLQEKSKLSLAQIYNVPGLGFRGTEMARDLSLAVGSRAKLGQDMVALSSFAGMTQQFRPNSRETLLNALNIQDSDEFKSLYEGLSPFIGKGIRANLKGIRGVLADHPGSPEVLNALRKMPSENLRLLGPEFGQMRDFAATLNKHDPSILKGGQDLYRLTEKQAAGLAESFDKLNAAMKQVEVANEKGSKREIEKAEFEQRKSNAALQEKVYGVLSEQADARVLKLQKRMTSDPTWSKEDSKELASALRDQDTFQKRAMKASAVSQEFAEEGTIAAGIGKASRRLLGGFGLMYLQSIFGFSTSGLNYGFEERMKHNEALQGGIYSALGEHRLPMNQAQILDTKKALSGGAYSPFLGVQQIGASQPVLRDMWTAGTAFMGASLYTAFAAEQFGSPALKAAAPKIGLAAAGAALLADSYSRLQDPESLGQRLVSGKWSITDQIANLGSVLSDKTWNPLQESKAAMMVAEKASKEGLTWEQMLQTQVSINQGGKGLSSYWKTGTAENVVGKSQLFSADLSTFRSEHPELSGESAVAGMEFRVRNNLSASDRRIYQIAQDYQFGGQGSALARGALEALGYTPSKMYTKRPGEDLDVLGQLQEKYTGEGYSKEKQEVLLSGMQRASSLTGLSRVAGLGAFSNTNIDTKKMEKFFELLEGMSEGSLSVIQNKMQAWEAQRAAGLRTSEVSVDELLALSNKASTMTVEQQTLENARSNALSSQAQTRLGMGQSLMQQSYNFGNYALGDAARNVINNAPVGQEWLFNRVMNVDPMMMALGANRGLQLSKMPGLTTLNGTQIGGEYTAMTDTDLQGNLTGMSWGTTSFRMGDISGATMANRLFGNNWQNNANLSGAAIKAGVGGFNLSAPITLPDGRVISSVGGQMGMQMYASQMAMNQQNAMFSIQNRGWQSNWDYQHQMWGIEDKQRDLSHQNTMWSFAFQSRQIDTNASNFEEQQQLNRFGSLQNRGWARQDWGYSDNVRELQWGWKQEDFQEEARFMTGRQRRLAERQMKRDTTMHNLETDKIDRDRGRQEELWKLEDKRFEMTKEHYEESVRMQREQLEHSKQYYLENRALENQKIALSRKHWEEEQKMQKESTVLSQKYAVEQHKLQMTMAQLAIATQMTQGQMNTLTADAMERFRMALIGSISLFRQMATELQMMSRVNPSSGYRGSPFSSSYTPMTTTRSGSMQPINVYVGNERIDSHIVKVVGSALAVPQ